MFEQGSRDWWNIVQTMPIEEALVMLNDFRSTLVLHNTGTSGYTDAAAKLVKVNSEIKRLNIVTDNSRWSAACRRALTPEMFDHVVTTKKLMEIDSYVK